MSVPRSNAGASKTYFRDLSTVSLAEDNEIANLEGLIQKNGYGADHIRQCLSSQPDATANPPTPNPVTRE